MLQGNDVGVRIFDQLSHDLQFPIFESLVLQYLFDRHHLARFHHLRLEYDAERSVPDDPLGGVRDILFQWRCGIVRRRRRSSWCSVHGSGTVIRTGVDAVVVVVVVVVLW